MLFNSLAFLIFLPTVFILYWFVLRKNSWKNVLLLFSSYLFYGWWDYRFLALIVVSTLVDYFVGLRLKKENRERRRKNLLLLSLVFNLGLLGFFKYYDFFIENWISAWSSLGFNMHLETLQIILPVGISFYTFQTLSYTIDVYRKRIEPIDSFIQFSTYVAFFPQLVAGPIERAAHLLPQFDYKRDFKFEYAKSGVHLIVWGLFQKIVIADNCATFVNSIFAHYEDRNTLSLILGAIYFAFQIYGDFAGYSNIAIGTARLFGFDLMRNFNYPYFSRDIAEFWRRWHISLSTWFRDYLYIPLGGSRGKLLQQVRNIFIIFLVSGFWHGANWTFLFWGFLHALFFLPLLLRNTNRKNLEIVAHNRNLPHFYELLQIFFTFTITCFAWIFFRAPSLKDSFSYIKSIFQFSGFELEYLNIERYNVEMLILIGIFILVEWLSRTAEHPFTGKFSFLKTSLAIFLILVFGVYSQHSNFIYFQF